MRSPRPSSRSRRWHLRLLAACVLSTGPAPQSASANGIAPAVLSALVRATGQQDAPPQGSASVSLRGRATLVVLPVGGSPAGMSLRVPPGSESAPAVRYRAVRVTGSEICKGECRPGKEVAVAFPAGVRCLLQVTAGESTAEVAIRNAAFGVYAGAAAPARFAGDSVRQCFLVPRGARAFALTARAGSGTGTLRIQTPSGETAASAPLAAGADVTLQATVERADAGRFWSVTAEPASGGKLGDVRLSLGAGVPPFLAGSPEALVLPFVHYVADGALFLGEGDQRANIEAAISITPQPDRLVRAQMTRQGSRRALWTTRPSPFTTGRIRILLPEGIASGDYDLKTTLLDDRGGVEATHVQRITIGKSFAYVGASQPVLEVLPPGRGGDPWRIRPGVDPSSRDDVKLRLTLYRGDDRQPAFQEDLGHPKADVQEVRFPREASAGLYRMTFSLVGPADRVLSSLERSAFLSGGKSLLEVRPPRPARKAPLRAEQRARGYVLFSREYHEAFAYNYEPSREEIGRPLSVWATPGEYEPASFGVYTLRPLKGARVEVGLLSRVGGGGRIEPAHTDVRLARFWPQRADSSGATFRIIPEILDPVSKADLPAGRISQYWLTLHVPPGTPAGDYRALITFRADNAATSTLKLLVKVLPFALVRPASRTWGLFADSERWRDCPDAVVEQEMRDMRAHGMDALAISAFAHATLACQGEKLAVDFAPLSRLMAAYRRAGLRGPVVLDVRDLLRRVADARGMPLSPNDPELQRLAVVALSELAIQAATEAWPDVVYQVADAPDADAPDAVAAARSLLALSKRAGMPTLMLLDQPAGPAKDLASLLNIACYPAEAAAGDKAGALCKAAKDAAKPYWWYGSGCRTTGQEGNIAANRYLGGVAFWRSGAAAHWAWTYQRVHGDAATDFDGPGSTGARDLCLTYPGPAGKASLPTLQWEGIREGMDDYRYLYTFQEMVARARRSKNARAATYAAQVEKEAKQRLDRLPWGEAPARLTDYDLHTLRKWLCKYMGTLVNKMSAAGR